jgi:curved DNA-binding protein CbpA
MSNAMKPTAEGNFQKTPLANVLLYSRERKMTGSIAITIRPDNPDEMASLDVAGLSTLVLENGLIVAAQTPSHTDTLSGVLFDLGAISEETYGKVQEALTKPHSTDEVSTLLRLRATDMTTIETALRELGRRKVLGLFGFPKGSYAYYAGVDLLSGSDRLRAPEDVFAVAWRAFSMHPPDEAAVAAIIGKLGTRALRLRDVNEFDRFEFGEELGLAPTQLRTAPSALDQLEGLAPDPARVRSMVYLLALTKQVEVAPPAAPAAPPVASAVTTTPGVGGAPARPPPIPQAAAARSSVVPDAPKPPPVPVARASSPEVASIPPGATPSSEPDVTVNPKWKEAKSHLSRLEHKNYFEMLDLADGASIDDVKAAFPKIASAWHPDRAPSPDLGSLYDQIFSHYNTAFATLTDKKARTAYEETLHGGGGTPAAQKKVAAVLDTVQDVHRAEVALRRRDYPEAEKLLRRVLAASDDDVSSMLLLAQCLMETDPARNAEEVISLMAKVANATENNDRARFYLGLALKAKNDVLRARVCFKQALEYNPNNIEASRELRLIEMRIQQRREEKASQNSLGGLFNKLLKK